jgi:hypothetical protein
MFYNIIGIHPADYNTITVDVHFINYKRKKSRHIWLFP